jgi:hypothetical protein
VIKVIRRSKELDLTVGVKAINSIECKNILNIVWPDKKTLLKWYYIDTDPSGKVISNGEWPED